MPQLSTCSPTDPPLVESTALSLGLAALLGLALAAIVYPPHFLMGEAARFYNLDPPNDAPTYRLAWEALVQYGRPWPSLWTHQFNYPAGVPITLMDGLPLGATIFRPLSPWLPPGFHYFGLWHAIAVTLQGIAGTVLVRAAGVRHIAPCLCAAAFAIAMPIFVGRLNWTNAALSTQGLLILAMALCVYTSRAHSSVATAAPQAAALSLVSLAVHPLLALQVLFFCVIAIATSRGSAPRRTTAISLLLLLFIALCQALGVLAAESLPNHQGLGYFGFSPWGMIVGEPDSLREFYSARGPGIEQDAWLGWGCVLLLAVGLVLPPRFRIPRAGYPLAGAVGFLALVAVSPWVRTGTTAIDLSFLIPDAFINLYAIHRATVRLAWALVISISLVALVHFVLAWPRRFAVPLIATALALQFVSIWPYWAFEYRDARATVPRLAAPPKLVEGGSHLQLLPKAGQNPITKLHVYQAMQLAIDSGVPLDIGRFARQPPSSREAGHRAPNVQDSTGTRYWTAAPPPGHVSNSLSRMPHLDCVRWEALLVCRND